MTINHMNTTIQNTTPLCYYRGYSFRTTQEGMIGIWRGGLISWSDTREGAEAIVDGWLDAR